VAAATTLCAMRARRRGGAAAQGDDVESGVPLKLPQLKTVGCVVALVQR
jgi:hypothetical protein